MTTAPNAKCQRVLVLALCLFICTFINFAQEFVFATFTVSTSDALAMINLRLGVVASVVRRMNEATVHWARLVLGWVTVFGRVYHHGV